MSSYRYWERNDTEGERRREEERKKEYKTTDEERERGREKQGVAVKKIR